MTVARLREALLALAGLALLAAITAWIVDVPGRMGIALYEEQFLALVLGCSAALLLGRGLLLDKATEGLDLAEAGQKEADEQCDDRDDHQQLDQCERRNETT